MLLILTDYRACETLSLNMPNILIVSFSNPSNLVHFGNVLHSQQVRTRYLYYPLTLQDEEAVRLESKLQTHKRDADIVTSEMQQEIRQLLKLCGLPYVDAPAEAEAQCAALTQLGLCEAVISDDSDSVVFGSLEVCND